MREFMMESVIESPVGFLKISSDGEFITGLSFCGPGLRAAGCGLIARCEAELALYFAGKLREFAVPIKLPGSGFRKMCWDALLGIPYGATASYGEIAEKIGRPKAARAVGQANRHNPIVIIAPCHRVIGAGGNLAGYRGGTESKRFLLELERGGPQ